jgi:hypothetical protein
VSYEALSAKRMTRKQAAELASAILGKTIQRDAWRQSVDRWAAKKGLPKVGLHKWEQTD